jgi:hypothetical protein
MPTDTDIEREFADLAELLREDRMEVAPFFARELDRKVAEGFPREPRWRKWFSVAAPPALAMSMLVAVVVGLASLPRGGDEEEAASSGAISGEVASGGGGGGSAAMAVPESARDAEEASQSAARRAKPKPSAGGLESLSPSSGSPRSDPKTSRKVETSAALVLGAKPGGVQRVADEVVQVTDRHRGFVITSSVDVLDGGGGAAFELRIPSDRLKPALADLSRIGDVRERREGSQDITQEFVSARSRLADARAERAGLLRQLSRATTDLERARVKALLRQVSSRISAAKTDLARVNNRASYSTITVSVVGDPSAGAAEEDEGGAWTPGDAAKDALRVLEVAVGVLLIALAVALPLALIGALALLLARLTQRRRRERLLDAV